VPEDVAGAPFMAVGSSAPEFFTVIRPARDRVGRGRRRHRRRAAVFNSMTIVGLTGIFAGHRFYFFVGIARLFTRRKHPWRLNQPTSTTSSIASA